MECSKSDMNQSKNPSKEDLECKQHTKSTTTIENLCNESFLEIFNYLDGCEIYYAFTGLNHRFQQLVNSPLVLLKINLDNKLFMDICEPMMLLNKQQIYSIDAHTSLSMDRFFSSFFFDSSFNRLESLDLYETQSDTFMPLLNHLSCLPRLFLLTLKMLNGSTNLTDTYRIIFKLPMLKYLHVITKKDSDVSISLPVNSDQQFSSITHIIIENHCTYNNILCIMSYTTRLHRLNYTNINPNDTNIEIVKPIKLSNLKSLFICVYGSKFDVFETFISKIESQLKILAFTGRHEDMTYLNANRWKDMIIRYLPKLEVFQLQFYVSFNNGLDGQRYRGKPNLFTSSFWMERKWVFEAERYYQGIMYRIDPYKTRWDEVIPNEIVNYSPNLSKSTQLTFKEMHQDKWRDIINVNIKHVLPVAQIFHLTITVEKFFLGILIPLVNSLPDLISLKLHSLSFTEPEGMNPNDIDIFFSMKPKNKIKKIYIEKINATADLHFLNGLCPNVEYVKVDWIMGEMNTIPYQHVHLE